MPEATTTAMTDQIATTTTSVALPIGIQVISIIFMIGAIRGSFLLFKDAKKHTWFAKIIRRITGIIQLLSIIGSIIVIIIAYTSLPTTWLGFLATIMLVIAIIGVISIITNIRWGILLFIESAKNKWFNKWIRIICGIIMIVSLFLSFILSI